MTVMISDYFEYYRLAAYLAFRTKERVGIVMGVPSLLELFDEKYSRGSSPTLAAHLANLLAASGSVLPHHISPSLSPQILQLTTGSFASAFVRSHLHIGRKWRRELSPARSGLNLFASFIVDVENHGGEQHKTRTSRLSNSLAPFSAYVQMRSNECRRRSLW